MFKRFGLNLALAATLSLALVSVAMASPAQSVSRANQNPGILPPASTAFGKTYGAWSVAWWQYVYLQPASSNPLTDPTGAGCNTDQSGPVFFLVGTFGGGTAARKDCVVPVGKALFFPLVNGVDFHVACTPETEGICDTNDTPRLVWDDMHDSAKGNWHVLALHASIDGVTAKDLNPETTPYRACAGPVAPCTAPSFSLTFPADNLFSSIGVPLPAGTFEPAVADGVYLMLAPLPPGKHTITFGGTGFFSGEFSQDITYNLTVK